MYFNHYVVWLDSYFECHLERDEPDIDNKLLLLLDFTVDQSKEQL